jgi:hypothetical protein
MLDSPNILHIMLALGGAGCVYAAVLEIQQRAIKRWHLFLPALCALAVATIVTLAQLEMDRAAWPFAAAFAIGLLIGGVRGARVPLKVDQYWSLIQVRRTTRRALLWVAAVVAADAALVCLAALSGQPVPMVRFIGALTAVACTGMLWARASAIVVRMQYAPHVDL